MCEAAAWQARPGHSPQGGDLGAPGKGCSWASAVLILDSGRPGRGRSVGLKLSPAGSPATPRRPASSVTAATHSGGGAPRKATTPPHALKRTGLLLSVLPPIKCPRTPSEGLAPRQATEVVVLFSLLCFVCCCHGPAGCSVLFTRRCTYSFFKLIFTES